MLFCTERLDRRNFNCIRLSRCVRGVWTKWVNVVMNARTENKPRLSRLRFCCLMWIWCKNKMTLMSFCCDRNGMHVYAVL